MRVRVTGFQRTSDLAGGRPESQSSTAAGSPARARRCDAAPAPLALASLEGGCSSRETYGYWRVWIPPPPAPNRVRAEAEVGIEDIALALNDARIPKERIALNGDTVAVDGLAMTITRSPRGITVDASGIGLDVSTVEKALHRLMSIGLAARTLKFLDKNPNNMVDVKIVSLPDGRLQVRTVAKVRIDARRRSQGQFVLDQLSGGLTLPDRLRAEVSGRNRRSQAIG